MTTVHWTRNDLDTRLVGATVDDLDGAGAVVLDGVTAHDDPSLAWCGRAPCVVIGLVPDGHTPPASVDVALVGDDQIGLEAMVGAIEANPAAARVLVDVLRVVTHLDVPAGLVVESLAYSMLLAGPEFRRWLAAQPARTPKVVDRPPVLVRRHGDVLRVTLDRPENRNAFSATIRDAVFEALRVPALDATIDTVALDGNGPVFSSGGDLSEFGTAGDVTRAHEIRTMRSVGRVLAGLDARVSVHLRGACVGAGVELAAFADDVAAEVGTTFRLPEVGMGLIPGAGGTVSLTQRIGRQRTAELALSGREMPLDEAVALGLVDVVV